VPVALQKEIKP